MNIANRIERFAAAGLGLLLVCGCGDADLPKTTSPEAAKTNGGSAEKEVEKTMKLTSTGFEHGARLADTYTVEGEDASPPLSWSDGPEGTKSFALICDDPDAPSPKDPAEEPWVHWVLFNIPADVRGLPQGVSRETEPEEVPGALQGANSWPSVGYRGPAPPPGSGPHRYFFKLYALDTTLELSGGTATKAELLHAMSGHVLATGELMGVYER